MEELEGVGTEEEEGMVGVETEEEGGRVGVGVEEVVETLFTEVYGA